MAQQEPSAEVATESTWSVFVGDLAHDVDDGVLQATFQSQFESTSGAQVMMDPVTGRSRGFGFVRFTNEEERDRAITEMNGVYIGSKPVRVGLATARPHPGPRPGSASATAGPSPGELDPNNTTLFVGGLSATVTEPELHAAFHAYGDIVYTKIPAGKGCGFVQFVQRQAAEQALEQMNGCVMGSTPIRVSWGKSSRPPPAAALAAASMAAAASAGVAGAQQQQPPQQVVQPGVRHVLPAGYGAPGGYYGGAAAAYGDPYGLAAAAAAAAGGGPYSVFGSPGAYEAAGAYGAHMGTYTLAFPMGADPSAYAGAYGYASAPAQRGAATAASPRNPGGAPAPGAAQQGVPRAGQGGVPLGGPSASSYEALMAMSMDKLNLAYMQRHAMLGAHAPQHMRVPMAMPVHPM